MNATIKSYLDAGLSVIPVGSDKRPIVAWEKYQHSRATPYEAATWNFPIAVIAGKISGGVICIDFDDKGSAFRDWGTKLKLLDPAIAAALTVQRTPSGGYHCVFRSQYQIRNKKLALRPGEIDPKTNRPKPIILIETRGEGGYFLAAPSTGYVLRRGSFENLKTLTVEQVDFLVKLSESFNQIVVPEPEKKRAITYVECGETPFDLFNMGNDPEDILISHGWSIKYRRNGVTAFLRPGKKPGDPGTSATWNHIPGRLYIFTNATPFEQDHVYKASAVYAVLEHGGDYRAAARALRAMGYHK